jgi:AmmeMemoRadiSam system protein B
MTREPVVAGSFYPGTKDELIDYFGKFINEKANGKMKNAGGIIVPHAGYLYSGKTASLTYKKAENFGNPERIIIFGPNHTGFGSRVSVWPSGKWRTPLGEVNIDEESIDYLCAGHSIFEKDELAHLYEHSVEVQLPFCQYCFSNFLLIPIVITDQRKEVIMEILEKLKLFIKENPSTLIIASSDLNHYENEKTTLEKDNIVLKRILEKDIDGLYADINAYDISMCGFGPASIVMEIFKDKQPELVYHTTSAEASGDSTKTVGYGGVIF